MARDLQARRRGLPPDLLTSALSSQRPEVRYAAARALELRGDDSAYLAQIIEVLLPPRPDKVADITDVWTFARDTSSRDPNWKLVGTESGQ